MFCYIPSSAVRILLGFLSHFGITLFLSHSHIHSDTIQILSLAKSKCLNKSVLFSLSLSLSFSLSLSLSLSFFFFLFLSFFFFPAFEQRNNLMLLLAGILIVLTTVSMFQITSQIAWKKTLVLIVCNPRDVNRALINSPCMLTTLNDRGCSSVVSALRC